MVNSRWLKMRKIIFGLFLLFVLASCVSQRLIAIATPTNKSIATLALPSETLEVFTPVVTATPIESNEQSFDLALAAYLNLGNTCKLVERLDTSDANVVFSETKEEIDNGKDFVSEIAKSANNKYNAYIVQSYALNIMSGSTIPIYCEGCGRVYLENNQDGKRHEIGWSIFTPGISMIYSMIWIDDNILVFREAQNEDFYLVLGVDVDKKEPVYLSKVSCSSK